MDLTVLLTKPEILWMTAKTIAEIIRTYHDFNRRTEEVEELIASGRANWIGLPQRGTTSLIVPARSEWNGSIRSIAATVRCRKWSRRWLLGVLKPIPLLKARCHLRGPSSIAEVVGRNFRRQDSLLTHQAFLQTYRWTCCHCRSWKAARPLVFLRAKP